MTDFLQTAYYFGCRDRAGHRLFGPRMNSDLRTPWHDRMTRLDGSLAPLTRGNETLHVAQPWRLTGYTPRPYSALSWWDRSVDKRPGSNIILFAPGHTVTAEDILMLGRSHFPCVPALTQDIQILPDWREKTHA